MTIIVSLYGGPGTGKCLEKSTGVLMFDGSVKQACNLKVGDLLMGPDSMPRKIKDIESGVSQLFRIKAKNGHFVDVTENHILPLIHSGNKIHDMMDNVLILLLKNT